MVKVPGVHLLPSTGEFAYDTLPYLGAQANLSQGGALEACQPINTYFAPGGTKTDYSYAMDQLQAEHPETVTVSLVCAWFFNTDDTSTCNIYPSTIFLLGAFEQGILGGITTPDHWRVSSLTEQDFPGIIPLPILTGTDRYVYGGTPADQSMVRCIRDLKTRGFRVIFYPFLLGTGTGYPWRGRITTTPDLSGAATAAVNAFLGTAQPSDFTPDPTNLTVAYSGNKFDWTYRRMILHYAMLCTVAGGVDCFSIGSELRGLETIRGPNWTKAGLASVNFDGYAVGATLHVTSVSTGVIANGPIANPALTTPVQITGFVSGTSGGIGVYTLSTGANGNVGKSLSPVAFTAGTVSWDYPFVAGLQQLAADVRSIFDGQGYTKNTTTLKNLIVYSADWSSWMGWQHPGENGQWPHLDSLFADANLDYVSFDDYLPISDWTTGVNGLDILNWQAPAPTGPWPPSPSTMSGLGLSGPPSIYSSAYLKANIEGGQYFNWFYNSGSAGGHSTVFGFDPNGSGLMVTLPTGDRLAQARNPYFANQQILAPKQLRWWWNNLHYAVYDTGGGGGWTPNGLPTAWTPCLKSLTILEYGFSSVDRATNQPNVFVDPKSVESASPFWSIWDPAAGAIYWPRRDDTIAAVALQALYEYWNLDGNNETSGAGVVMIDWTFACAWNWDARPFPTFPIENQTWGDTANWQQGDWANGLRAVLPPPAPSPPPSPGTYPDFPALAVLGWSTHVRPKFSTVLADHVSGRSSRLAQRAYALYEIELTYEVLRSDAANLELQAIAGFFAEMSGADAPFWVAPPDISALIGQALGIGDGTTTVFPLIRSMGGYSEPAQGTSGVSAVYLNGVSQASGWTVSSGYAPAITFGMAPGSGVAITADFGLLWLCRFAEDVQDFEEFMTQLWTLRTLRLTTVRP
jgi:hypothetical protein